METNIAAWGQRDPAYTLEKLKKALRDFNESDGEISDRLYEAYFQLHLLREDDFPGTLRPAFRSIITAMTEKKDPAPDGHPARIGDARFTLRQMSTDQCLRIVSWITALISEVESSMAGLP